MYNSLFSTGMKAALEAETDAVYATTCSRWSTRRRIMGEPYPGRYGWKYHPWVREVLDSEATYNVTLKSAQGGWTEVAMNRTFWNIDIRKKTVLYVLPTEDNARKFAKDRFDGAGYNSPYIKNMWTNTNSIGLKQAGDASLYISGSRSEANLVSVPAGVLVLDEFDRMSKKAVSMALKRLSGHPEKEVWFISTPTLPNYGVSKEYLKTTQEHFMFSCPCCSRTTELVFPECLEIVGEGENDPRIHGSFLKCKECGGKLEQGNKWEWLAEGKWAKTYENGDPDRRGFHISQLYSSTVSPAELAGEYFRSLGDEAANQEWHNQTLGVPFLGETSRISDELLENSIQDYRTKTLQPPVGSPRLITMGYDQGKIGYYVVVEWLLDSISSDINMSAVAKVLDFGRVDQDKDESWQQLKDLMGEWQVKYCICDADQEISDARRFCRYHRKHAAVTRYRRGNVGRELSITDEDSGAPMIQCDRTSWCDATLGRFRRRTIMLPSDVTNEFKSHMQNLVKRYSFDKAATDTEENAGDETMNPIATYVDTGPDHYAHALVYAEMALPFAASKASGRVIHSLL